MKDIRVARRYAAALFGIAVRDEIVDAVGKDLSLIERLLKEQPALGTMVSQPLVTAQRKEKMVSDVFSDNITAISLSFLKLLIRKRRADLLSVTIDEFRNLLSDHLNIVDATAQTAVPLSSAQIANLTKSLETLTGKRVNLRAEIDPKIVGGVTVRIGDNVIDGSVSSRLHRLEQHLLGA